MKTFKNNFALNLNSFNAISFLTLTGIRSISLLIITLTLSLCSVGNSYGQDLGVEELSSFSHQIVNVSNSGNTMTFVFELGTPSNEADHVAGYDITLDFPKLASDPDQVIVSVANSWVGSTSEGTLTSSYDAAANEINFEYLRNDSTGQNGSGELVTISVIREGGFSSTEFALAVDGGIIMVDNMDFKWHPGNEISQETSLNIYPNPASEYVKIETGSNTNHEISLFDLSGRAVRLENGIGTYQLDLNGLQSGIYFIQVKSDDQLYRQQLVVN